MARYDLMNPWRRIAAVLSWQLTGFRRSGLPTVVIVLLLICAGIAAFSDAVALIESESTRAGFYSSAIKLSLGLLISTVMIQATAVLFRDRVAEMMLASSLNRLEMVVGLFLSGMALSLLLAVVAGLVGYAVVGNSAAMGWSISLSLFLMVLSAVGVLFALALKRMLPALMATVAVWVLCISMPTLYSLISPDTPVFDLFMHGLTWILPTLAQFAPSGWLLESNLVLDTLIDQGLETAIFILLLISAGWVDLKSRPL
ncbi:MAG: hypothetical protein HQL54_08405 [Magnetococcales bacterium]|nr:hypothetical protein [Magnetococcales bacterium]